jgi:Coenzyme PQQ synthesis protein D (PqqD)
MKPTLEQAITIRDDVLVQDLGGELVLLNLNSEEYFGLDDVGSIMWNTIKESASLQAAYDLLVEKYDVEPKQLLGDFLGLVEKLMDADLIAVKPI